MGEANRKCKNRFVIRMFPEEMELFERKAQKYGTDKTTYVRNMLLKGIVLRSKITPLRDENFHKLLRATDPIGNNLNQIQYNSYLRRSTKREEIVELSEKYSVLLQLYIDTFCYPVT